jgi:hypothetical protein
MDYQAEFAASSRIQIQVSGDAQYLSPRFSEAAVQPDMGMEAVHKPDILGM